MRAARVHDLGGSVVVEQVDDPSAGPGEAVVEIAAAAVNFADLLISRGEYQVRAEPPFTPGSEFAGTVASVGDGVVGLRPGDRVVGAALTGAFAEQIAVPAAGLVRVPDGADLREAAAFRVAYGTSYSALRSVAAVRPGEWVAVLGAAGGVGLAGVEIAAHMGARVVACASSDDKVELCLRRGAHAGINYASDDLKVRLRELTEGGAHVVLDPVGGPYSEPALRSTRYGGRFVVVGFASGEIPRLPLNLVLLKGVTVMGFEIWSFRQHRAEDAARDDRELIELLAQGALRPHISGEFPLDAVGDALEELAGRRATGRVLVVP
jgi:NADPH2:quinone reductase